MKFSVSGKLILGGKERTFEKVVEAPSEAAAKHITFALFGSHNGTPRNKVSIEKVTKVTTKAE